MLKDFTIHNFIPDIYTVHPEDGRRRRSKDVGVGNKLFCWLIHE